MSRLGQFKDHLQRLRVGPRLRADYANIDFRRVRRLHFVCKGNVCRSAYADALARQREIPAHSSGVAAGVDVLADASARRIAAARGVCLESHRTRPFESVTLDDGDLVIAMEPWQASEVRARASACGAQVTLMGLWAPVPDTVVNDPYGLDDGTFHTCFGLLEAALDRLVAAWRGGPLTLPRYAPTREQRRGRRRLKTWFSRVLFASGAYRFVLRKRAIVVVFHSIGAGDDGDGLRTPLAAFADFCQFFRRHFEVVELTELVRRLRDGQSIDGCLAVTFDDGYRDNVELAEPVLRQFAIPATFFVTTGFVASDVQAPWDVKRGVASKWLSWAELNMLRGRGHAIGSHTVSHVKLDAIDHQELERELTHSRNEITTRIGHTPSLFAVPFGRPEVLNERVQESLQDAGYEAIFTAIGGVVTPNASLQRMNRFPIAYGDVKNSFELGFDMLRECLTIDRPSRPGGPSS